MDDSEGESDGLPPDYKEAETKALETQVHHKEDTIQNLFGSMAKSSKNDKDMESLFLQKAIQLTQSPWESSKKKHDIPSKNTTSATAVGGKKNVVNKPLVRAHVANVHTQRLSKKRGEVNDTESIDPM